MNIRLLNNYVLVRLDDRPDWHYKQDGSKFIQAVHNVEHWRFSVSSGEVIAVCDKLTNGYTYGTTIEIKPGDKIIFSYMAIERDPHKTEVITHNRKIGNDFIIRYDEVFCAVRDGEIIPVNGWCILEGEMEEETSKGGIIIPEHLRSKRSQIVCTIKHMGTPNTRYNAPLFKDFPPESDNWYIGQKVVIPKYKAIPLQNEEFSIIYTGLPLYRAQRKDMDDYSWVMENIEQWQKEHPWEKKELDAETVKGYNEFIRSGDSEEKDGKRFFIHKRGGKPKHRTKKVYFS